MSIDRVQDLLAALDQLKAAAMQAEPKELPPLIREQRAVLKELDALGVGRAEEDSTVVNLTARIAERKRRPPNQERPAL